MSRNWKYFTKERWQTVRTHPYFKEARESLIKRADSYAVTDPPRIKFSEMHLYAECGDRNTYESRYNEYNKRVNTLFIAYMVTEDKKYLAPLYDVIWNVLDMETWTPPAHIAESYGLEFRYRSIDLCSSIMGMRLAEIVHYIGDEMPELLERRIREQVRYRIIESYEKYSHDEYRWERNRNNWNAVCTGAVFSCYFFLATDAEIDGVLPRMLTSIEGYLSRFDDDGCCVEGYGYWRYGFTYFCIFAELLLEYTDGRINLFDNPKVHSIAKFQQNVSMNAHECISFSDSALTYDPPVGLSHFIKKVYSDVEIAPLCAEDYSDSISRTYLWADPALESVVFRPKSHIFEDTQWFVYHNESYSVATKAGFNAEMHNHNDVGSFIFSKDDKVTFCDPGLGMYDAYYFRSDYRYKFVVCSSRGHSVPIINGEYQVTGNEKSVIYDSGDDRYVYSMENAYKIPTLDKLTRAVYCETERMRLVDTAVFTESPTSFTERFVSLSPISGEQGALVCLTSRLIYDPTLYDVSFSEETITRHGNRLETLYIADLTRKELSQNVVCEFEIV